MITPDLPHLPSSMEGVGGSFDAHARTVSVNDKLNPHKETFTCAEQTRLLSCQRPRHVAVMLPC